MTRLITLLILITSIAEPIMGYIYFRNNDNDANDHTQFWIYLNIITVMLFWILEYTCDAVIEERGRKERERKNERENERERES